MTGVSQSADSPSIFTSWIAPSRQSVHICLPCFASERANRVRVERAPTVFACQSAASSGLNQNASVYHLQATMDETNYSHLSDPESIVSAMGKELTCGLWCASFALNFESRVVLTCVSFAAPRSSRTRFPSHASTTSASELVQANFWGLSSLLKLAEGASTISTPMEPRSVLLATCQHGARTRAKTLVCAQLPSSTAISADS
jgi:hypothetical protein